jgi:hypothetical protein
MYLLLCVFFRTVGYECCILPDANVSLFSPHEASDFIAPGNLTFDARSVAPFATIYCNFGRSRPPLVVKTAAVGEFEIF